MARPRKEDAGKARQSIVDAFWELLGEMPYSDLSIRVISGRASVNHNTFYRHFDNIDDLAKKAFEEILPQSIPALIRIFLREGQADSFVYFDQPSFQEYIQRARLFVHSGSLYLEKIIQDSLKSVWLNYLSVEEGDLTDEEVLELNFLLGGFVAAMRANTNMIDARFIQSLLSLPLYRAAITAILQIGERSSSTNAVKEHVESTLS